MNEMHDHTTDDQPTRQHARRLSRPVLIALGVTVVFGAALAGILAAVLRSGSERQAATAASALHVAYLAPADASAPELYLADLVTGTVTQLTTAESGIEDFAVSPSGDQIAYTRNNADGTSDVWLVDVARAASRPLTACVNARCSSPAWHPDETRLLYQREDVTDGAGQARTEARAWVVDVRTAETRLLFDDPQLLGMDPQWSPDADRIAVYDPRAGGIRVHALAAGTETLIPIATRVSGTFSPDGTRLIYPVLVRGSMGQAFYTHLTIANMAASEREPVSGAEDTPVEDGFASWSPDGSRLVVARRYLDERYTSGKQLYTLELATGAVQPLVVDAQYTHAAPQWDAAGQRIVYQRFDLRTPDAVPEIWVYDEATGDARQVATNAFFPAWVP